MKKVGSMKFDEISVNTKDNGYQNLKEDENSNRSP
jgi:hypothetical protein